MFTSDRKAAAKSYY